MTRVLLTLTLVAACAPGARGQSPLECVPDIDLLRFGPEPVPDPTPYEASIGNRVGAGAELTSRLGAPPLGRATPLARPIRNRAPECPTLTTIETWDGEEWDGYDETVALYNASGNTISISYRSVQSSSSFEYDKITYEYVNLNLTRYIKYKSGNTSESKDRMSFTYDSFNRIYTHNLAEWRFTGWRSLANIVYAYDTHPYISGVSVYDGNSGALIQRGSYTYTPSHERLSSSIENANETNWTLLEREDWFYALDRVFAHELAEPSAGSPGGYYRIKDSYTFEDTLLVRTNTAYNTQNGWRTLDTSFYEYDANGRLITQVDSSSRSSGVLMPTTRRTYAYGPVGLDLFQVETWVSQVWRPDYRTFVTRDLANRTTEQRSEVLTNNSWINSSRVLYEYREAVSTDGDAGPLHFGLTSWPNPATNHLTLRLDLDHASTVRVTVSDALGREVAVALDGPAADGPNDVSLDVSGWPAGVYIVRVVAGARTATQRVTVVR